jgi:hypothetical protein
VKNLFWLLIVLFSFDCSAQALQPGGALEVHVRDLKGNPIAEATVYAVASDNTRGRVPRFRTDANGIVLLKGLRPGTYEVHAFKESEGYADTLFAFFSTQNTKAWQFAEVVPNRTTKLTLELGPRAARLKISVRDDKKNRVGGSLLLSRIDDPKQTLEMGTSGETIMLVPPTPFRFKFEADGYRPWRSEILKPRPDETIEVTVNLRKK